MSSLLKWSTSAGLVCAISLLLSGCEAGDPAKALLAGSNKSNVQRLSNLYHRYQSAHKWVGPSDAEDFKKFVQGLPPEQLEMMTIDPSDIDGLFLSERDGQELLFRYKVPGSPMGKIDPVVFEKTGVNGVRMVGFTANPPKAVSDQTEYDDLMAGKFVPPNKQRGAAGTEGPPKN